MKKYLIIFVCALFAIGCNSNSSFNNKKLAGEYSLQIAMPDDDQSELGQMGSALTGLLSNQFSITFYENGEGYIYGGTLDSLFSNSMPFYFKYTISQDSILNFHNSNDSVVQHIMRKVGDSYDYIKMINPKTKEVEITLVRQATK